jgi:putative MATE family efflux protein
MTLQQEETFSMPAAAEPVLSGQAADPRPVAAAMKREMEREMERAMQREPVVGPLLRLAWPTIAVLVVQTLVSVIETYFVGHLGTDALAGVTLVFPVLMLMTMMSNGGIGAGVSSATARAIGAGRKEDADALALHAAVLAIIFGVVFSAGVIGGGRYLYELLGGSGAELVAAQQYSLYVFGGAILIWLVNLLSSSLRGAGDVRTPAWITVAGALIIVPLSPALIFGFGPIPAFGIAGAGLAVFIYYALAALALVLYMRKTTSAVRLVSRPFEWRLFKDILGVGGLSAIGTTQANVTVAIITSLVGIYGTDALAGYGIASRLDYVLIPLVFGLGTATITLVGQSIGANKVAHARRIAWISALIGGSVTEIIGLAAALFPHAWLGLFTDDPKVLALGASYLATVAPFYGFVGVGLVLYFATQGAKRVLFSVLSGTVRLAVAFFGGWLVIKVFNAGLPALFMVAALSSIAFGGLIALSVYLRPWSGGAALHD